LIEQERELEPRRAGPDELDILVSPHANEMGIGDYLISKVVGVNTLEKNLKQLTEKIGRILKEVPDLGNYKLSEVTVAVNVTGTGELQLVGVARGKTDIGGAFTLKFIKS
jgi:hypothetical protein